MNSSLVNDKDSIINRIKVMLHQEETRYQKSDYFSMNTLNSPLHRTESQKNDAFNVDVECRSKMVVWCYQIIDFCKLNRETVEIAISFLDRFLNTAKGSLVLLDQSRFQLACMTALYTTVKINEAQVMDLNLLTRLSRGSYKEFEIELMEREMLNAIDWRLNPPTILAFCREVWKLIPEDITESNSIEETVLKVTRLQSEFSVQDYSLVEVKASTIAFCSIMNALESLMVNVEILKNVGRVLATALEVECNSNETIRVQNKMYDCVLAKHFISRSDIKTSRVSQKDPQRHVARTLSPKSIARWF